MRVVILGGTGPMFSSGHDLGSKAAREEMTPARRCTPRRTINGGTRKGAESLMLQEWHYFFENTRRWRNLRKITIGQAHGDVYAAGLMLLWACDLIVWRRARGFADVVGLAARHVRRRVLRPPVGVRAAARRRSFSSPATRWTPRRPTGSGW